MQQRMGLYVNYSLFCISVNIHFKPFIVVTNAKYFVSLLETICSDILSSFVVVVRHVLWPYMGRYSYFCSQVHLHL